MVSEIESPSVGRANRKKIVERTESLFTERNVMIRERIGKKGDENE